MYTLQLQSLYSVYYHLIFKNILWILIIKLQDKYSSKIGLALIIDI